MKNRFQNREPPQPDKAIDSNEEADSLLSWLEDFIYKKDDLNFGDLVNKQKEEEENQKKKKKKKPVKLKEERRIELRRMVRRTLKAILFLSRLQISLKNSVIGTLEVFQKNSL